MFRTRVKVCGMTRPDQAKRAVELGVDAIGMILHADSPRTISVDQAKSIREVVPAFVQLVGVTVNADPAMARSMAEDISLDLLQLHGEEDAEYVQALGHAYIKAVRAKSNHQVHNVMSQHAAAKAILLDPYVEGLHGGTGHSLSEDCWPTDNVHHPLILAGGLTAENVQERILRLKPYAVDLNSGLEISPGNKDLTLLEQALKAVKAADALKND